MGIVPIPFTLFQSKGIEVRMRSLKYDMNAMAEFEQLTGMGLAQLMSTRAIFATTRALLWAGLKHNDRGLTVDRVGTLMQEYVQEKGGDITDLLGACIDAAVKQKAIEAAPIDDEGNATVIPPEAKPAEGQQDPNGPVLVSP